MSKVTFDQHLMIRHSCDLKGEVHKSIEVRGRGGGETNFINRNRKGTRDGGRGGGGGEESLGSWQA